MPLPLTLLIAAGPLPSPRRGSGLNHLPQIRQGRFRLLFVGFIITLLIHSFQEELW